MIVIGLLRRAEGEFHSVALARYQVHLLANFLAFDNWHNILLLQYRAAFSLAAKT